MKKNLGEIVVATILGVAIVGIGVASFSFFNKQVHDAPTVLANEEKIREVNPLPHGELYRMELPGFVVYSNNYSDNQIMFYYEDEYILPFSDSRYLDYSDLMGLDQVTLKFARNEIYARYGRIFKDVELQTYFENKSWYYPLYEPDQFPEELLSDIEKENAMFISNYEN